MTWVQRIICFMLLLPIGRIIFLLNMIVDKTCLKEYFYSVVKPSPLKEWKACFSFLFYFHFIHLSDSRNIHAFYKGKECSFISYLRKSIAQFKLWWCFSFLTGWRAQYYLVFSFCQQKKIRLFLIMISDNIWKSFLILHITV